MASTVAQWSKWVLFIFKDLIVIYAQANCVKAFACVQRYSIFLVAPFVRLSVATCQLVMRPCRVEISLSTL